MKQLIYHAKNLPSEGIGTMNATSKSPTNEHNNNGVQARGFDSSNRHNSETKYLSRNLRRDRTLNHSHDPESMELYSRARAQQEEILFLREQVSVACVKVAEDERYMFTSSMLGLLGEHSIWPHFVNASTISNTVKHLHDQLQFKIRTSHDKIGELMSMEGNDARDRWFERDGPGPSFLNGQLPYKSSQGWHSSVSDRYTGEQHMESTDQMSRNMHDNYLAQTKSLTNNDSPLKI
ncbi:uncharacterized protein LOC130783043 isoform X4 [Actinidia eriantha]|uniref:uncharacterized protein LOC130783043 isoform X4 n=1 Tax=Actinidia eriantha TaxID=165200 RepID=UPI00258723C4|nr:uncharacterized protein LOC130783043 isoform X4 [Actinidia eriantha]